MADGQQIAQSRRRCGRHLFGGDAELSVGAQAGDNEIQFFAENLLVLILPLLRRDDGREQFYDLRY
jgi:hypothetical protein